MWSSVTGAAQRAGFLRFWSTFASQNRGVDVVEASSGVHSDAIAPVTRSPVPAFGGGAFIGALSGLTEFRLPLLIGAFRFAPLKALIHYRSNDAERCEAHAGRWRKAGRLLDGDPGSNTVLLTALQLRELCVRQDDVSEIRDFPKAHRAVS